MIEFIFMLTRNDETLADAREVYASIAATAFATSAARTWAFRAKELQAPALRHQGQRPHVPSRGRVRVR